VQEHSRPQQQADFAFFSQRESGLTLEQQLATNCATSWQSVELLSLQPQHVAGRDWTKSITTAIQALACAMIGLDAVSMVSLILGNRRDEFLTFLASFRPSGFVCLVEIRGMRKRREIVLIDGLRVKRNRGRGNL
jgi:hypothetical protein